MPTINIRKTGNRAELDYVWQMLSSLAQGMYERAQVLSFANLGDGTTDGKIQNQAAVAYGIGGAVFSKAATDDLWDLTGLTDTEAGEYLAVALCLDDAGTASIVEGTVADSAEDAIDSISGDDVDGVCVVGVYVADPETDWNGAAGLAAQGTFRHGFPSRNAVPISIQLVAP